MFPPYVIKQIQRIQALFFCISPSNYVFDKQGHNKCPVFEIRNSIDALEKAVSLEDAKVILEVMENRKNSCTRKSVFLCDEMESLIFMSKEELKHLIDSNQGLYPKV